MNQMEVPGISLNSVIDRPRNKLRMPSFWTAWRITPIVVDFVVALQDCSIYILTSLFEADLQSALQQLNGCQQKGDGHSRTHGREKHLRKGHSVRIYSGKREKESLVTPTSRLKKP